MFRVKNIALDETFRKYGKNRLQDLSDEELLDVCAKFHVTVVWIKDKRTGRIISLDKLPTIQNINKALTLSEYMGEMYWPEDLKLEAQKGEIFEKLAAHTNGSDTFLLMEGLGVGFCDLAPGQERIVNFSSRWIKDILTHKSFFKFLELENLDEKNDQDDEFNDDIVDEDNEVVPDLSDILVEKKDKDENKKLYNLMSWDDLRKIASKKNILRPRMNRDDIINALNLLTNA